MLATQKEMLETADARYKEMEARIAFLTPPTMSAEEQASRLALRKANLDEVDQNKSAENLPSHNAMIGTTALTKGKGKGKSDAGVEY